MADVFIRQLVADDLEPELIRLATPIARRWEAAALRVAAHHADPNKFKLPTDPNSPEMILAPRFNLIAKQRPARAKISSERALDQLALPKTDRKLKRALDVNFSTTKSVEALAKKDPPVTKATVLGLIDRHYAQLGVQRTTTGAPFPEANVGLDLIRVVCIDETNGFLGSEAGEDEISMSALTLDESANAAKVDPFHVADFDDGDRKDFVPPKRLFTLEVGGGTSYPKHYFATMLMFEVDQGDLDETMEKILRKFADEVATKVSTWLGGAAGSTLGPLGAAAGAIIGWIVGWLVGKIVDRLIAIWEDDPFVPRTLELMIPSATSRLIEPSKVFHFRGPGEYAVRYRWSIT